MTSESPDWDPQGLDSAEREASMLDLRGHVNYVSSDIIARVFW
jgi:hypothetical protein